MLEYKIIQKKCVVRLFGCAVLFPKDENYEKGISVLLTFIMVLSIFTIVTVVPAEAAVNISCIDDNGDTKNAKNSVLQSKTLTPPENAVKVTADTTAFEDGYTYLADTTLSNNNRIEVQGSATLLLNQGVTLTLSKGIHVGQNNAIEIYGDGKLIAGAENYQAAIGGNNLEAYGAVTINGGEIEASGGNRGAGIGGGQQSRTNSGDITITGGKVTANGNNNAAGIGGGWAGSTGTITSTGGQVTANGGQSGSNVGFGIGPGKIYDYSQHYVTAIVLGWTDAENDYIQANSFGESAYKISFLEGKTFVLDSACAIATADSIMDGGKLISKTASMNNDLRYAVVGGVEESYAYTGAPIEIIPTLTDISGNPLTEVTDYTVSLKRGDEVFSAVKEIGTRAKESDPFCDDGITKNPI